MVPAPDSQFRSRIRSQLADRRARLEATAAELRRPEELVRLLAEVDSALSRLDTDDYGVCAVCHTSIAQEDLLANPMATYCLCELSPEQQQALQKDLDLAWHVQAALLPKPDLAVPGWRTHYRYLPHGPVSGDYCDLIAANGGGPRGLYFMVGDVSGKGVAASLLMAHLNALLRTLARTGLPPEEVLERASRALAESTLASHYATLVCGRAHASGEVEFANAGHCAPVVVRARGAIEAVGSSGFPLGLTFGTEDGARYPVERIALGPGDVLVIYTDGLTEAVNAGDEEYGAERLFAVFESSRGCGPRELIARCLADVSSFQGGRERHDDLTVMAIGRE
jgi:sigma-B regulation protein RsbU (phosphoserine phosphatase)